MHLTKPLNKDNQTAEELFAARNERLHRDAKEWLMRTTENCTILSVFIATVAFAAAYTEPGAVLGRCTESSKNFVAKFLEGVAIGVGIFVLVLFLSSYLAFSKA
ncbi:hypothetical protein CK203_066366 [Vitis vinifera]|uniref:PGG domain-containing protein n=1 Tax=Vitis vinifera TaxID=29760 RepID=A0A438FY20_VITVI|nr:hypothetical protein CK203_066366 [Vitis vinifera]